MDLLVATRTPFGGNRLPVSRVQARRGALVGQSIVTGTSFAAQARAMPDWRAMSRLMLDHVRAGHVPSFMRESNWRWVESRQIIDGKLQVLRMRVSPDFLPVGIDTDYLVFGPTPAEAQSMADHFKAILPSRKLATLIDQQSPQRLPLADVKGAPTYLPLSQIETIDAVLAAREIDRIRGTAPGAAGHRKDIVVGPNLDGGKLAIFGGGGGPYDGWAVQPYSTIHHGGYGDYSQGLHLIARRALLNGVEVDLATIFTDPKLHVLVSDMGPFVPRFPNAGLIASAPVTGTTTGTKIPLAPSSYPPHPAARRPAAASASPIAFAAVLALGAFGVSLLAKAA